MDARAELERLIAERREDYASLSRLIGRNAAYIQQFIKRGTPKRLSEEDRRLLARYFGVSEESLGGPPSAGATQIAVPRLEVDASAGAGALGSDERTRSRIAFDPHWLRALGATDPAALSIIEVRGDSMVPTLGDGDEILVDRGDAASRLRDGIYVLRADDALVVKRLALSPASGSISVRSDNPAYPPWPDCRPDAIDIVGRVVWVGRRIV